MPRARPDATTQAVKLLAGRDKSAGQLEAALRQRGYGDLEIAEALARVRALGYLDDARVAKRQALLELDTGWAPEGIVARLGGKGVAESIARAAVQQAVDEAGWSEAAAARKLVAKRRVDGVRAARLLASRGFSEGCVEAYGQARDDE